jgi:hypothetical protein
MKNILVQFDCRIGDYEHQGYYIFNKKKSKYGYCKEFWGIKKKDSNCLSNNQFWDNEMTRAISVYSEKEITNEEIKILKKLGVIY